MSVPAGDIVWKTNPDGSQLTYNLGDVSWVLSSVGSVFILAAGVGFFYSGLLRRKSALSALYVSMASIAVVTVQVCMTLFNKMIAILIIFPSVVFVGFYFVVQRRECTFWIFQCVV